jgi:hypothetical protein
MTTKPKTRKAAPVMNVETLELTPRPDALLVDGQLVELAPGEALSMIYGRKVAAARTKAGSCGGKGGSRKGTSNQRIQRA